MKTTCAMCGAVWDRSPDKKGHHGTRCPACVKKMAREYYKNNKILFADYRRRYREARGVVARGTIKKQGVSMGDPPGGRTFTGAAQVWLGYGAE